MTFNSLEFLLFFGLFAALWPYLRHKEDYRFIFIVTFSIFFLGWWNWRYVFLFLSIGLVTHGSGLLMTRFPSKKRMLLFIGSIIPLVALGVFKYYGFFLRSVNHMLGGHLFPATEITDFILPIGISFYTFMALSYIFDIYAGKIAPAKSFMHYLTYLSLFAHLVAGPIIRGRELLPQILGPGNFNAGNRWYGIKLIVQGFAKKVLIADNLAPIVNKAFIVAPADGGWLFWWVAAALFALQIYCDFSGYSDIARGIARWMGYHFPRNFDSPYFAFGFRDFWTRWHITLSNWFRDYVYIPLGGSRKGKLRTLFNLWITMLLAGLWHGANWTFIAWGALHAMLISLEHLVGKAITQKHCFPLRFLVTLMTVSAVILGWVFFRAPSLNVAVGIIGSMFSTTSSGLVLLLDMMTPIGLWVVLFFIAWQPIISFWRSLQKYIGAQLRDTFEVCAVSAGIYACVFFRGLGNVFIYFQF